MYFTVYKVVNKLNDKFYIGKHQTKNLNDGYMGSGKLIKAAIKKYGIENFEKHILYIFDSEAEMNAKEKELVFLGEGSYNLCEGGKGGFGYINANKLGGTLGLKHSEKTRLQMSKVIRKPKSFEEARKISNSVKAYYKTKSGPFKGKFHSEESLQKMRKPKNIGPNNSQYGTCWITNNIENRKIPLKDLDNWIDRGYNRGRIKV